MPDEYFNLGSFGISKRSVTGSNPAIQFSNHHIIALLYDDMQTTTSRKSAANIIQLGF